MTMTGEGECASCGQRVLVVRKKDDGKLIRLEPQRTDGGWLPQAQGPIVVAQYVAPDEKRQRDGHHAHDLRCPMTTSAIARSRRRISDAVTERAPLLVMA